MATLFLTQRVVLLTLSESSPIDTGSEVSDSKNVQIWSLFEAKQSSHDWLLRPYTTKLHKGNKIT